MKENTKNYYAINFNSLATYLWLLIALAITTFATFACFVLVRDGELKFALFTLPFILLFPTMLIHGYKSRIILTSDSIIRTSLFKRKELKYKGIKTLKRYDAVGTGKGNVSFFETDGKQLDSKLSFSTKMIYVSEAENSHPNNFSKSNGFTFHETSDVYSVLKGRIRKSRKRGKAL